MKDCIEKDMLSNIDEEIEKKIDESNHDTTKEKPPVRELIGKKTRKLKEQRINEAIACDPINLNALRELTTSKGGLLTDELRRKVWPKLVNLDSYELSLKPTQEEINSHPEYVQVDLDVQRSLRRFPPDIPKERRLALQNQLTSLIIRILIKHKDLHYYQGYHDVCVTFLLVLGEELAFALLEKLSVTRFKIFMEPTMESTISFVNYVSIIVEKCSPQLYSHLEKAEVSPVFCLSWLITWFGHVLNDYRRIVRLYDFFLATHELMPIYLATCVITHRQEQALALEPEMPILHHFLCNIPDDMPFESLVQEAAELITRFPPAQVIKESAAAVKSERRFYHHWISTTQRKGMTSYIWNTLAYVGNFIVPSFVPRPWFFAASIVLPVVVAIGWYSIYHNKTPA